jgi:hypothetical protein
MVHAAELSDRAPWPLHVIDDAQSGADGARLGDLNGDGLLDVTTGFEEGDVTRAFLHPGQDRVTERWPAVTVGKTPSVEDAVFVDLDGDGRLDIVSSCEGDEQTLYVHWAPAAAALLDAGAWKQEAIPASVKLTRWMFATPFPLGDGTQVLMAGGKNIGAAVGYFRAEGGARELERFAWRHLTDAGWIMSLIVVDMDGDGDQDLLYTDRKGPKSGVRWLEQPANPAQTWNDHLIGAGGEEVMFARLADLDGDGVDEVLVAAKPSVLYILKRGDAGGTMWEETVLALPGGVGRAKGVAAGDLDGDGLCDVTLSCESADGALVGVYWLEQQAGLPPAQWPAHPVAGAPGTKYDRIELIDLDGDGDLDLMTCEEREGKGGLGLFWHENPHAGETR